MYICIYKQYIVCFYIENHSLITDGRFYTLEVSRTNLMDSGVYSVTAKNILGSVSCCCRLVVDKGIKAYIAPEFFAGLDAMCTVQEGESLKLTAQVKILKFSECWIDLNYVLFFRLRRIQVLV